jgi:hypothetical protein
VYERDMAATEHGRIWKSEKVQGEHFSETAMTGGSHLVLIL